MDCELLPNKQEIIQQANEQVAEIEQNYRLGMITNQERRRLSQEVWIETTEKLADLTWENFSENNPIKLIIDAKVGRVSRDNIKQLSAMRGLVVDPNGNIVEMPTKSNYREGLTIFEYVTSARGGRKGLTDTAIKTADAGYLTRRLVDVAHDMIIRIEDCGTDQSLTIERSGPRAKSFGLRIAGRFAAEDIVNPETNEVIVKKGELIEDNIAQQIDETPSITVAQVRSPLTCKSRHGLCATCYGLDYSDKTLADLGTPVGVLAAQSIGEPGTQLTMRTKHSAGVIGVDVTQGLPRVEELFESRTPKVLAPIAEISGKVSVRETDEGYTVTVTSQDSGPQEEKQYVIPATSKLLVSEGDIIPAGAQLAGGSLDIKEVMRIRGLRPTQLYLIEQLQEVYESQGIPIHDKHFEVIVRKMSDKVRIHSAGDTTFLIGDLVELGRFEEENLKVAAEGGELATGELIMLGITRTALHADNSWLSAASFQHTTQVLSEAAIQGSVDNLMGLKENVIIGRLIPTSPERARLS